MQSVTQSLSVAYDAKPSSVATARAALAEFAADVGATAPQVDAVRLAASEAVTNAVLHAYRGAPGKVHVTAALAGAELWILIADDGGGLQPQADRPGLGLGLALIAQVCNDMAIAPRSSGGTEVRICFEIAGAEQPEEHGAPVAPDDLTINAPGPIAVVRAAPLPD